MLLLQPCCAGMLCCCWCWLGGKQAALLGACAGAAAALCWGRCCVLTASCGVLAAKESCRTGHASTGSGLRGWTAAERAQE